MTSVSSIDIYTLMVLGSTDISRFGCDDAAAQSIFLTPGAKYVLYCFVNNTGSDNSLMIWTTPSGANLLIFSTTNNAQTSGVFSAKRVSSDCNTINSSLTFTAESSLDEGVVLCRGNQNPMAIKDNCTLLVYSKGKFVCRIMQWPFCWYWQCEI